MTTMSAHNIFVLRFRKANWSVPASKESFTKINMSSKFDLQVKNYHKKVVFTIVTKQ